MNILHGNSSLKVTAVEAERVERSSTEHLLAHRKLSLVVDLDQTILHASMNPMIAKWMEDPCCPHHEAVKSVIPFELNDPFTHQPTQYFLKLRNNLLEFLNEMKDFYELHIYTMGTRSYASKVVSIIDPTSSLFHDRILSRDDSGSISTKELSRIFPCGDSMVVVIDDRSDVWKWSENLIPVKPYEFFVNAGDFNDPAKLQSNNPQAFKPIAIAHNDHEDDELKTISIILKEIHAKFYEFYDSKSMDQLDVKAKRMIYFIENFEFNQEARVEWNESRIQRCHSDSTRAIRKSFMEDGFSVWRSLSQIPFFLCRAE